MITPKFASSMNWMKRMLKGAIGTTMFREPDDTNQLTAEQRQKLDELCEHQEYFTHLLKAQVDRYEDFFATFGSDRTKHNIARRKAITDKMNAGKWEEVTEEEMNFLYPKPKKPSTK